MPLIVTFALVSFVPLGLLTFASLKLASSAVEKDVHTRLRSTAAVGASAVRHEMEGLMQVVVSYADRPALRAAVNDPLLEGGGPIDDTLDQLTVARKGIATAFIADLSGRLLAVEPPTPGIIGDDFSYRDWYKGIVTTNRPYVSEVYRSMATGRPHVVGVAAPVHAPGSKDLAGMLVVGYSIEAIRTFADITSSLPGEKITVVDQSGTVVAAPGDPTQHLRVLEDDPRVLASLSGRATVARAGPSGDELSAYAPIPGLRWTVITSVDATAAFAGVARLRSVVATIATALGLVLCAGLVVLALVFRARARTEVQLRASERRFVKLIEVLPVGLFVMTPDGHPYLANKEAQRLLGKGADPSAEMDELPEVYQAYVAGTEDPYPADALPVVRALKGETSTVDDMEIRQGDTVVPIEVRGAPIYDEQGRLLYALATFTDISDRRIAEEQAEHARAEAERANLAKSEFLSRMSHELRTPLNAILGFAQLLSMDAKTSDEKESLGHILKGGHHLVALINEVLDIARIESGTLSLSLEPVEVDDTINDVIALGRPLAKARDVNVSIGPSLPGRVHVLADKQRLKQVLLNLFSNAVKYNKEGGTVEVAVSERGQDRVRITVTDSGQGIDDSRLDRVFVPFDRLGAEQTTIEGTGIGLSLSQALVRSMGGTIGVESAIGIGSLFWVELATVDGPVEPALQSDVAHYEAKFNGHATTVLSIEDNPSNVKLLERIFSRRPSVTLLNATEGALGLSLARQHQPDLILLDLNLPDIQGVDVLKTLKADRATAAIPVIVLSADATRGQLTRLITAGARDYLTKPIDVQMCLDALDEVLNERDAAMNGKGRMMPA